MRKQRLKTVSVFGIGLALLSLAVPPTAYGDDKRRDRGHRRNNSHAQHDAQRHTDGYSNQGYSGNTGYEDPYVNNRNGAYDPNRRGAYGTANSGNVVDRTLYNLNIAAGNSRVDGHERGHFNKAQKELSNFQSRWAQGRFETGRLDSAIRAMQDLVNSDQVNGRDQSVLANDLAALRQLRSSGGQPTYYPYQNNRTYGRQDPNNHPH